MNLLGLVAKARFALSLPKFGSLLFRLFRDARVPFLLKAGTVGFALLAISPIDLLSDIPVLGVLDDAALLLLAANAFVWFSPGQIVEEHRRAVGLSSIPGMGPGPWHYKDVTPKPM